jgi:dipeptidase E
MAEAERWAADISGSAYAIDDETAIKVLDGTVEVVSEGRSSRRGSGGTSPGPADGTDRG